MKKLYIFTFALLFLFVTSGAMAQSCPGCVIDNACVTNPAQPTLCPSVMPDGTVNQPYDQDITFYMPAQFTTSGVNVTLNQITVNSVTGIPAGINWQTSAFPSNIFYPSQNPPATERGCVKFCGTPTAFGLFNIIVSVTADVSTPIGPISQDQSFSVPLIINPPAGVNSGFSFTPALGCNPIDVSYQALITAQPGQFVTYNWNFANGNTSTSPNPPVQQYAQADTYSVSLNTRLYSLVVNSLNVTATGTGWCGDIEEPNFFGCVGSPDLFYILASGGASVTGPTVDDQMSAAWSNIGFVLSDNSLSLTIIDEDLISANDNLGTVNINIIGPGTYSFANGEYTGTMVVDTVLAQSYLDVDTVISFPNALVPVVVPVGDTVFCNGQPFNFIVNNPDALINWYLNDTTLLIGQNQSTYTPTQSGSYSVVTTNAYNCSASSNSITIEILPVPPTPVLVANGGLLSTSAVSSSYAWTYNGMVIPGANQNSYAYGDTGIYCVIVTNADGCASQACLNMTVPSSVPNVSWMNSLNVFPNPSQGEFIIQSSTINQQQALIQLFDLSGRMVHEQLLRALTGNDRIQTSLPDGTYLLRISSGNQQQQKLLQIIRQ
jgi:hypothetical protein